MRKKILLTAFLLVLIIGATFVLKDRLPFSLNNKILSPLGIAPKPKPLLKYTFSALQKRPYSPSEIKFEKILHKNPGSTTWLFSYLSDGSRVSGAATLPNGVSTASAFSNPVVILLHGYVEQKTYYTGFASEHVANYLATNGYVTFAPDYLGYGESDKPSADVFEERFQTYTTVLNLISSLTTHYRLPTTHLGLWAHSNGGQIALSVLAISGKPIPSVLWAPVSKPFPYNILYYTDQFDDRGKSLRKALADFEKDYDVEPYSTPNFWSWIKAPILLLQGSADNDVPKIWTDQLDQALEKEATTSAIRYQIIPGADHNMTPGWNEAASRTLNFFNSHLQR